MASGDSVLLLTEIADYLEANGIGTQSNISSSVQGDLFVVQMPQVPIEATVVAHSGGLALTGDPTRRPAFQVQHRSVDPEAGLRKAVEINTLLDDKFNVLASLTGRITLVGGEPGQSFVDANGHLVFPLSYQFTTTEQR